MKIPKTVETVICDECGASDCYESCFICGVDHCFECKKTKGRVYQHAIYVSGSGDGYYCNACDAALKKSGGDRLHQAYLEIQHLRSEARAFETSFRARQETAERALRAAYDDLRARSVPA